MFHAFDDFGMHFLPSDGRTEDIGISALDDWFNYNPKVKIDKVNQPICYIHRDCGNLIDSIINYNSNKKMDEPLKDFFDALRYLRMHNAGEGPDFVDKRKLEVTKKNKGGF